MLVSGTTDDVSSCPAGGSQMTGTAWIMTVAVGRSSGAPIPSFSNHQENRIGWWREAASHCGGPAVLWEMMVLRVRPSSTVCFEDWSCNGEAEAADDSRSQSTSLYGDTRHSSTTLPAGRPHQPRLGASQGVSSPAGYFLPSFFKSPLSECTCPWMTTQVAF